MSDDEIYDRYSIPETINAPQNNITVPLLMPLVTLMERQAVVFEGLELWESSDQSGEIMLRHLGTARLIAQHAETFGLTAERLLQGRRGPVPAPVPLPGREKSFSSLAGADRVANVLQETQSEDNVNIV